MCLLVLAHQLVEHLSVGGQLDIPAAAEAAISPGSTIWHDHVGAAGLR
jgi:hypothetical protein